MSYQYIEYQYPVAHLFHKELLWVDKNCNVYFAFKFYESDDWSYYAGNASHALKTGQLLTSYGTSESLAQTNYLTTVKDTNGKVLAVLPANFQAKYARIYIQEGSTVTIHEWTPSTYITVHELISGTLEITDQLSDAPLIKVVKSSVDRLKIGNFSGEAYGVGGYDASGNKIFELSNVQNVIGGVEIGKDYLRISGEIEIDAANKEIKTVDFASGVFGKGWRINKNEAEFQNITARGKLSCSVFEKSTYSAVGGNLLITEADILSEDMDRAAGILKISGSASFVSGEILRVKNGSDDEWIEVTNVSDAPTYNVIRDITNLYPSGEKPLWKKGTAVTSTAVSGEGFILLESSDGAKISMYRRNSSIWNDYEELVRIGNLKDFLTYTNNIYGIGIGTTDAYLTYEPSNSMRIKGAINATSGSFSGAVTVGTTGQVIIDGANEVIKVFSSTVTIEAGVNDDLDWTENGVTKTADLDAGDYTPSELATEIQAEMRAAGDANTVVSYSSTTKKITIANSTLTTFTFKWSSGTNAATNCGRAIGFDVSADDTGALSYTADYECALRVELGNLS